MSSNALERAQTAIRSCTRCVEAGYIPQANPILRGNSRAKIMIVGQAPAPAAMEYPVPYSGASGKTLQAWLLRAGFESRALHDPERFYLTSLTKCFPGRAISGSGDRPPSRAEIALCGDHLRVELELVSPDLILALGRLSIGTFLPSVKRLRLDEIIGGAYRAELAEAGQAQVLPLPHPSGVSRWHNLPQNQELLDGALRWLATQREENRW